MNEHEKLNRIDDAFLFIVSFVGLLVTIAQGYLDGIRGLIALSPILFFGVVLPFYIGHIRGAIGIDSLIERVRGWVYLAIGTGAYIVLFLQYSYEIFWAFLPIGLVLVLLLENWFNNLFKIRGNIANLYAIHGTVLAGFFFASFAFVPTFTAMHVYIGLTSQPDYLHIFILNSPLYFLFLFAGVVFEKVSRYAATGSPSLDPEEVEFRLNMNFWVRLVIIYFDLVLSVFHGCGSKTLFLWIQAGLLYVIGSLVFFAGVPVFDDLLFLTSTGLASLGTIRFVRLKKIDLTRGM